MLKFCTSCGAQQENEGRFCSKCGAPRSQTQQNPENTNIPGAVCYEQTPRHADLQLKNAHVNQSATLRKSDPRMSYDPMNGNSRRGMQDIKTVACSPQEQVDCIRTWESFGYYLQSSSEVHDTITSIDVEIYGELVDIAGSTTVINYVRMIFRRDSSIPNYSQLKALEEDYENVPNPGEMPEGFEFTNILWGLALFAIPGILMLVYNFAVWPGKIEEYNQKKAAFDAERSRLVNQAQTYAFI